jgi:hypothetical protein
MMQSFDTQLQVSMRALSEVVAPALQADDGHAIEQLHLVIATLNFTRQRLPYARSYHRLELQYLMNLAADIRRLIGDDHPALKTLLSDTEEAGKTELARPEAEIEDYLIVGRKLRELITEAVQSSADKPYEQKLDTLVTDQQKQFFITQRVYCAPLGLDHEVEQLPSIEELIP